MWAYYFAYFLSLLRLPFALVPYLVKLATYYYLGASFSGFWGKRFVQLFRTFGDFMNFLMTTVLFYEIYKLAYFSIIKNLLLLSMMAEALRLVTEKGVMIFSVVWQIIPHRQIAAWLHGKLNVRFLKAYISYYILSDQERLEKAIRKLKVRARFSRNTLTISRLRYVKSFKVVSDSFDLRAGEVRSVARGEIYVHAKWTNDLNLLYGLALRRSPWIFDPRFLRRPFYYRTEANRLMTIFVFENFGLCPLYAIYQFGHEIKSARFEAFFRIARWFGYELEKTVRADGTYNFEPFAKFIFSHHSKLTTKTSRPLWTDDEVIADLTGKPFSSALEIAEKYTYPLIYVQEVLLSKLLN